MTNGELRSLRSAGGGSCDQDDLHQPAGRRNIRALWLIGTSSNLPPCKWISGSLYIRTVVELRHETTCMSVGSLIH